MRLAAAGLVHAAGVHRTADTTAAVDATDIPGGAEVVGFASWREGLVVRPGSAVADLRDVARLGLRLANREPGARARTLLDRERVRLGLTRPSFPATTARSPGTFRSRRRSRAVSPMQAC